MKHVKDGVAVPSRWRSHLMLALWVVLVVTWLMVIPKLNRRLPDMLRVEENRVVLEKQERRAERAEGVLMGICSWNGKELPLEEALDAMLEYNRRD